MAGTARKSDPALWDKVKAAVLADDAGGKPGQWSARKAQRATAEYKKQGGGYLGPKRADNHLAEWTREDWGTQSGAKSLDSGERYLPRKARESLTSAEYRRSTARKRQDLADGKQFSAQPADVARKSAAARRNPKTGKGKDMGESNPQHETGQAAGHQGGHADDPVAEFRRLVNIPAAELRAWLDTWDSQSVGFTREGEEEAVGHRSGRRILELLQGDGDTEADADFRRQVVGYIHRHLAQRPDGDVTDTRWRHSLMNWGHDPMRDTGESTTMTEDSGTAATPMPESEAATPARKPRARRAAAPADGATPARKPRAAAKPATKASPARKPARAASSEASSGRSPAKAATARGNGAKASGTTARRTAAATPKRATAAPAKRGTATATKRAASTTTKRAASTTTKRAASTTTKRAASTPTKRAASTTTKRAAAAPARRSAATTPKRATGTATKRATGTAAKRTTGAATKRATGATTKRATGATTKRATATPAKRGTATAPKRASGTAAKRPAAPPKRGAAAAKPAAGAKPKRTAAKAAAPKRAAPKAAPRGAAGRTAAAAKGGRSSAPRSRG